MAKTTETLLVEIGADIKDLKDGLKQSKKGIDNFSSTVGKMGGVLAGVFAVDKIKDFAIELSQLAGKAEGIEAAFARIGGGKVLDDLREATKGTVGDLELMQRAVQAKNFDIPLKDLASLFQFATKRAQETGESVDFLTNSIVLGIGRKSPLILDNLGISAIRLRKELKGAGTEAATVGDVAAAVGKIAQTEMAKSGDIIQTTAIKTAQWGASVNNLKVLIGKELNKALNLLAPTIDSITKGMVSGFDSARSVIYKVINGFIDLYNESVLFRGIVEQIKFVFKTLFDFVVTGFKVIASKLKNLGGAFIALFKGDFEGIVRNIKEIFTESAELYKGFGKRAADNYSTAFRNTFAPEEKIELLSLKGNEQIIANNANLGQQAAQAYKQSYDEYLASLSDIGPVSVDDELDEGTIFGLDLELMKEINAGLIEMGLNARYAIDEIKDAQKITPVMEAIKGSAESIGFALGEMAVSGERSLKRLVQQIINMAKAIFLAKSASLGLPGVIAGLAGFGILSGLASKIGGGGDTFVEGDKIRVVTQNSNNNNLRRF